MYLAGVSGAAGGVLSSPRRLVVLDGLAAIGYVIVFALPGTQADAPAWAVVLMLLMAAVPVPLRWRWPMRVFLLVLSGSVLAVLLGVGRDPFLAAAYAFYPVAVTAPDRRGDLTATVAWCAGVLLVLGVVAGTPDLTSLVTSRVVGGLIALTVAWTVGRAVRDRRVQAGRASQDRADRAVVEERLRLARELHDVVAGTLSLIGVRAAVANHVAGSRPEQAGEALRLIETASREGLIEMRRMLGVLRDEDFAEGALTSRLQILVDRTGEAGVEVELDVDVSTDGVPGLSPAVAGTVYRVVQEALTNVVRHAAPTGCRVRVRVDAGAVDVEVIDGGRDGRAPLAGSAATGQLPGHGLVGMRERVAALGGTLTAGRGPAGGFRVHARFPLGAEVPPVDCPSSRRTVRSGRWQGRGR